MSKFVSLTKVAVSKPEIVTKFHNLASMIDSDVYDAFASEVMSEACDCLHELRFYYKVKRVLK